ncbi:[protein-PII] uridylyltransferase [Candidatus Methylacidiphilum infernorum]|uniref:Bifunctional uridylyltransferase/uridylyl-removing enzyme n=1 Tax=Methylacidiphilum infernorum (isolate V4) TaxID=481448 RepID=B3E0R8_METI4|nr:[protein-PII] uridylyltransferase [Candidatus Methylacidiphilum infernorum]ACD82822.1 UTP:GlnB (protein PII) uridylyltransferase [Methylacidiphilum infernorum V4]
MSPFDKSLREIEKEWSQSKRKPKDLVLFYKNFLKKQAHHLRMEYALGLSGKTIAYQRAELFRAVLTHLWTLALEQVFPSTSSRDPSVALLAVGGFGRKELSPASDIDLFFLYDPQQESEECIFALIHQILYFLWDIGLDVGHSTHQLEEIIASANKDLQTKTALLDADLVCGSKVLWEKFRDVFEPSCIQGKEKEFIEWRLEDLKEQHQKYGGTVLVQEPNIKWGCGGLRDYQSLYWILRVKEKIDQKIDQKEYLLKNRWIESKDWEKLEKGYDFLLRVREELHYREKRKFDLLTLGNQGKVATAFGYPHKDILRRIEEFMRQFYDHALQIYLIANTTVEALAYQKKGFFSRGGTRKKVGSFAIEDHCLEVVNPEKLTENPLLILRAFSFIQRWGLRIGPTLKMQIKNRLHLLNAYFLRRKDARNLVRLIFSRKGQVGEICRQMHEIGLLGKLFPEFAPLRCLVQHEFFHRYTADEHTLRALEVIDSLIGATEAPYKNFSSLFQNLQNPFILYLAILLHDTGRAGSHKKHHEELSAVNAMNVAKRLKLSSEELSQLVFLVDQHLLMGQTAVRRNLEEEETILEFARVVMTQERLDMLMLLTFADQEGTGESSNWSSWKNLLLWELYHQTSRALSNKEEFIVARRKSIEQIKEKVKERLSAKIDPEEIDAHFNNLPLRYFQAFSEESISVHIEVIHHFLLNQVDSYSNVLAPVVKWIDRPEFDHSEVIIVTWDRLGVFSRICGSFAVVGLSILSADIHTRTDGIVLDVFKVCTSRKEYACREQYKDSFCKVLEEAFLDESYDIFSRIPKPGIMEKKEFEGEFPTSIQFDQQSSKNYTILDIQTPDKPALLYRIANALLDLGIEIVSARIATEKGAALDTFYILNSSGNKVTKETEIKEILKNLRKAIGI